MEGVLLCIAATVRLNIATLNPDSFSSRLANMVPAITILPFVSSYACTDSARCPMRLPSALLAVLLLAGSASAADKPPLALADLPGPFTWQNQPADYRAENSFTLSIPAGRATDWFVSPMDGARRDNSPRLLFTPAPDFVLSAKVTAQFHAQRDGGGLVLYVNDGLWAKLAVERAANQHATIVSVVTRGRSDDNNSIPLTGPSIYLKMARAGDAIFFYASEDGVKWFVVRTFSLGDAKDLRAGFTSQSPLGQGCTTRFDEIKYAARRINLWTGDN